MRLPPIRVLLPAVTALTTLALVTLLASVAHWAFERREHLRQVPVLASSSFDLFTALQNIRLERGAVTNALETQAIDERITQERISGYRVASAEALDRALKWHGAANDAAVKSMSADVLKSLANLQVIRAEIDDAMRRPAGERSPTLESRWIGINRNVLDTIGRLSNHQDSILMHGDAYIGDLIRLKQAVWSVRVDSADDRFLVRRAMTDGKPLSGAEQQDFAKLVGRIDGSWDYLLNWAALDSAHPALKKAILYANRLSMEFRVLRDEVLADLIAGRPLRISPTAWIDQSASSRQAIIVVATTAGDLASQYAAEQFEQATRNFYLALVLMGLFLLIGVLSILYVLRRIVNPMTHICELIQASPEADISGRIPYQNRMDEIGWLARAVRAFHEANLDKQRLVLEAANAEAANRTKSAFLASMSHELRTPLNAIIGYSEVIKIEMFGPLSERYRSYGADIFDSGTHLLALINDILDLSKLEARQLELNEEDVELAGVIRSCLHLVEQQAKKAKVSTFADIDNVPHSIRADDRRLRQILINLLSNAIKFTPEGGEVCVRAALNASGLMIAVRDTGIGMSPEQIPIAMEAFRQIDSTMSRKHHGTGLGLPLARHLVELHGGTLRIDSEVNIGTTVSVILPPERATGRSMQWPMSVAAA